MHTMHIWVIEPWSLTSHCWWMLRCNECTAGQVHSPERDTFLLTTKKFILTFMRVSKCRYWARIPRYDHICNFVCRCIWICSGGPELPWRASLEYFCCPLLHRTRYHRKHVLLHEPFCAATLHLVVAVIGSERQLTGCGLTGAIPRQQQSSSNTKMKPTFLCRPLGSVKISAGTNHLC